MRAVLACLLGVLVLGGVGWVLLDREVVEEPRQLRLPVATPEPETAAPRKEPAPAPANTEAFRRRPAPAPSDPSAPRPRLGPGLRARLDAATARAQAPPSRIVAVVMDARRNLAAKRTVAVLFLGQRLPSLQSQRVVTDEDGRLDCVAPDTLKGWRRLEIQLQIREGQGQAGGVLSVKRPLGLSPGINDLGTLWLETPPVLAFGQVVLEAGDPVPGAVVQVLLGRRRRGERWHPVPDLEARCDGDGRFELSGLLPRGMAWLGAHRTGLAQRRLVKLAKGARLVMEPAGGVEGKLLIPLGLAAGQMTVALRGTAVPPRISEYPIDRARQRGETRTSVAADGRFRVTELLPDSVRLEVLVPFLGDPLFERGGITVRAGETTRLGEIDLRGLAFTLTVTVVDAAGEPIPGARVTARAPGSGAPSQKATTNRKGEAELWSATTIEGLHVIVDATGYRQTVISRLGADRRVTLGTGIAVLLVANAEVLAQRDHDMLLEVDVSDPSPRRRRRSDPISESPPARVFGLDAAGEAYVRLPRPGSYTARVWARSLTTDTRVPVTTGQTFRVRDAETPPTVRLR